MPIDLEREIIEIKTKLAVIEEKLDRVNILADDHYELAHKVQQLELTVASMRAYAIGAGAAVSAVLSIAISIISKLIN